MLEDMLVVIQWLKLLNNYLKKTIIMKKFIKISKKMEMKKLKNNTLSKI